MKISSLITRILGEPPRRLTKITSGLTNTNFRVETATQTVVLRVPPESNKTFFDYEHEAHVLELIKPLHLDPELIYYDPETGIKCSRYIPNAHSFHETDIIAAAGLLKRLHAAKIVSGSSFNILEMYTLYHEHIDTPLFDTTDGIPYLKQAQDLTSHEHILCHNDCVSGNFLFTNHRSYLIDFEYAKDNHPYFDIMSLLTENDIQDPSIRNAFYRAYFGFLPDASILQELKVFEIAHHTLWCSWAMMMHTRHHEAIYYEIAELKHRRLQECLNPEKNRTV